VGAGAHLAAALVVISGLAGSSNWSFRPQLLAYPLFVLTLHVLLQWQYGNPRRLWLLPLMAGLWVNLHGSFPLLFLLLLPACLLGGGNRAKLAWVTLASAVALLINPRGLQVFQYVIDMLTSPSNRLSSEWLPPANRGWQANIFFLWILLIAPLAALGRRRLSTMEWAWFALFGWLGLSGTRYGIWLLFLLPVFTARLGGSGSERSASEPAFSGSNALNVMISIGCAVLPFAFVPGVRERWWNPAPPVFHGANPIGASAWLADHPEVEGPLWSDFSHSSYLIFAQPERPVWIDPRFELYPVEHWERYRAVANAARGWESMLDEEQINLVMLSTGGEPALIREMVAVPTWCEVFRDQDAVIFARTASGCQ
jgi:hypothetical protein